MTSTDRTPPVPRSAAVLEYGLPAALWLAAKQSGVFDLLFTELSLPSNSSPSHFLLLAAFDRVCHTKKDTDIAEWYERSILHSLWGFASEDFALEEFRDCFEQISAVTNQDILETIQSRLLGLWTDKNSVSQRLFAYDMPSFYTYIASSEEHHQHATDRNVRAASGSNIRRVGVSYVLDGENALSLCHQLFDGNAADSEPFSAVLSRITRLLDRHQLPRERVTLVSGKSSAALANIKELEAAGLGWISALTWDQTPEDFRRRPVDQLQSCNAADPGIFAVAERMHLFGKEHLCVLQHSASFQAAQVEKLTISLSRATQYLRHFARQLNNSSARLSEERARARIQGWLSEQYLAELVEYCLQEKDGRLQLEFEVNGSRLQWLLDHQLGRTFLLTNRLNWSAEELVNSFSAQEMVDTVFRGLHDGNSIGWTGPGSWSEANLRVHTFYCMLAVSLLQFMYKPVQEIWPEVTLELLLEELHEIKQFVLVYSSSEEDNSERVATVLSELTPLQQALAQVLCIDKLETQAIAGRQLAAER